MPSKSSNFDIIQVTPKNCLCVKSVELTFNTFQRSKHESAWQIVNHNTNVYIFDSTGFRA